VLYIVTDPVSRIATSRPVVSSATLLQYCKAITFGRSVNVALPTSSLAVTTRYDATMRLPEQHPTSSKGGGDTDVAIYFAAGTAVVVVEQRLVASKKGCLSSKHMMRGLVVTGTTVSFALAGCGMYDGIAGEVRVEDLKVVTGRRN